MFYVKSEKNYPLPNRGDEDLFLFEFFSSAREPIQMDEVS